ncbi:hypothetical protein EV2_005434 [Malus domestica]
MTRGRRRRHFAQAERWWCRRRIKATSELRRHKASCRGFQPAEFWRDTSAPAEARILADAASFSRTARWRGVSRKGTSRRSSTDEIRSAVRS